MRWDQPPHLPEVIAKSSKRGLSKVQEDLFFLIEILLSLPCSGVTWSLTLAMLRRQGRGRWAGTERRLFSLHLPGDRVRAVMTQVGAGSQGLYSLQMLKG